MQGLSRPTHQEKRNPSEDVLFSFLPGTRKKRLARHRAGIGTCRKRCRRRLPWFHRASPSTTLNEIRFINEYG
jgi:hypothetical protein